MHTNWVIFEMFVKKCKDWLLNWQNFSFFKMSLDDEKSSELWKKEVSLKRSVNNILTLKSNWNACIAIWNLNFIHETTFIK